MNIINKDDIKIELCLYKRINKIDNIFFHMTNYGIPRVRRSENIYIGNKEYILEYRTFRSDINYIEQMIKISLVEPYKQLVISIASIFTDTVVCETTFKPKICYIVSCTFLRVVA